MITDGDANIVGRAVFDFHRLWSISNWKGTFMLDITKEKVEETFQKSIRVAQSQVRKIEPLARATLRISL